MHLEPIRQSSRLTPRQMQILKTISDFQSIQCFSPTIGELAKELSISRSTVFEHTIALRKKGLLTASPGKARSFEITTQAYELINAANESYEPDNASAGGAIPLAGRVAAGLPIEAIEQKEFISFDTCFSANGETFALQVAGDSMIDDNIYDGDYVICRSAKQARNGQLVVAIVDEDNATLKRIYKEKTRIRLQPANDNYLPVYTENCRIQAIVVGLVRKF